jgi:hypothetical protein
VIINLIQRLELIQKYLLEKAIRRICQNSFCLVAKGWGGEGGDGGKGGGRGKGREMT